MKKLFAVALLACILLSGCAVEETPKSESSRLAQNKYLSSLIHPFIESDSAFYSLNARRICYYDKQSGISDILCPDPSCTHEDETCGAYLEGGADDLFCLYDGKLYWFGLESPTAYRSMCLWRCDTDGTNHEKVKVLDYETIVSNYAVQKWVLHENRLFFYSNRDVVVGTQALYRITFGYIPLDGEEIVVLYQEDLEGFVSKLTMFYSEQAEYLAMWCGDRLTIRRFDLKDDSMEEILNVEMKKSRYGYYSIWVTEDGALYFAAGYGVYEVRNGALRERFAFETQDNGYVYLGDGIAVTEEVIDGYRMAEIRDFDGNLIYNGKLFPEPPEGFGETIGMVGKDISPKYSFGIVGGDSEKLVLCMGEIGNDVEHFFSLDIRDSMKATYLFSCGLGRFADQ